MDKIPLYSELAKDVAQSLGLTIGKPNLEIFADTLMEMAEVDPKLLVVTSDSRGSGKLIPFARKFPDQIVEVGIAEQNLVGVAAGLASTGRSVFAVSPACFLTARSLEQIKNDIAYSDNPVTLVGISAGVSYGALGSTHHSLHDLAALRAINNMNIVVPADNFESRAAVRALGFSETPGYLRFGKAALYDMHSGDSLFKLGKAIRIREGIDVTVLATGELVQQALLAGKLLETKGIGCDLFSVHSLRPLDTETILNSVRKTHAVITIEEHMLNGGLGEAVATVLMEAGVYAKFQRMGIPDEYTITGSQAEILYHYNLLMEGLSESIAQFLQ